VFLIGGGAQSEAVRRIAPAVLGVPVLVPPASEYVADGAARQAAWVLAGNEAPPAWPAPGTEVYEADPSPQVRERYGEVRDLTARRETRLPGALRPPTCGTLVPVSFPTRRGRATPRVTGPGVVVEPPAPGL
jgi:xylulokinase